MNQVYGNLIVALEKAEISKSELASLLGLTKNTMTARFKSDDTWTLKEMKAVRMLLAEKGVQSTLGELFERV